MRKFIVIAVSAVLFAPNVSAQLKWSFETSVEESFILGDRLPSFNPISINDLANNSGVRVGTKVNFNDKYFGRVSLGVVEAGRIGYYQTKLVPVELAGGLQFYSMGNSPKLPLNWNADLSIGSSFIRAQSSTYNRTGNNSLSENIGMGLSLDVMQTQQALISIGYRHYFFWGDNLDALQEKGGMDQLSRWYLNSSFDLSGSNSGSLSDNGIYKFLESVSWYTSVEESFVIGDQFSSLNLLNLSNAANNSGIRTGISTNVNEKFGLEASFGVVGSARLNGFSTNLIPVELLGRYSFYSMGKSDRFPLTWSGEVGPGISLVRSQTSTNNLKGLNSVSNSLTVGLSLDIFTIDGNDLAIGYRHTFYGDDNIDGLITQGGVDQLSRWQLSYRINLLSKAIEKDPIIELNESELILEKKEEKKDKKQIDKSDKKSLREKLKRNKSTNQKEEKPEKRGRRKTKARKQDQPKTKKTVKERIAAIRELNKTTLKETIVETESLEDNVSEDRFSHMDSIPESIPQNNLGIEETVEASDISAPSSKENDISIGNDQIVKEPLGANSNVEKRLESMSGEIAELKSLIKSLLSNNGVEVVDKKNDNQETIEKLKSLSQEIETILKSLEGGEENRPENTVSTSVPSKPVEPTKKETPLPKPDFKEINVSKKNQLSRKDGYAIILKTFDTAEEAQEYASKIPGSLGKPFVWELIPLKKYRVVLGVYTDNYEMLYKVEEMKYYGYSPWVTRWY